MSYHYIGDVFLFTSGWDNRGILECVRCNGQTLKTSRYQLLYYMLELQGQLGPEDNEDTFTVPDLTSSAPPGLSPYIVATGDWPAQPNDFTYYRVTEGAYIGEVDYSSDPYPPSGWAACDGSLIPLGQNPALYNVLGIRYGGDGKTTFGLPNVPGAVVSLDGNYPQSP